MTGNSTSVHDVAAYIIDKAGPLTTMKLQKLCYYAQGWHLAWDEAPLFGEEFHAWAFGPVCIELFRGHVGNFEVSDWPDGEAGKLDDNQRETVDGVLDAYGRFSGRELAEKTQHEAPWRNARGDCPPGERSDAVVSKEAMQDYFGGLLHGAGA